MSSEYTGHFFTISVTHNKNWVNISHKETTININNQRKSLQSVHFHRVRSTVSCAGSSSNSNGIYIRYTEYGWENTLYKIRSPNRQAWPIMTGRIGSPPQLPILPKKRAQKLAELDIRSFNVTVLGRPLNISFGPWHFHGHCSGMCMRPSQRNAIVHQVSWPGMNRNSSLK